MKISGLHTVFPIRIAAQLGSWRRRKAEIAQLQRLDNRMLEDIGMSPSAINDLRRLQWR